MRQRRSRVRSGRGVWLWVLLAAALVGHPPAMTARSQDADALYRHAAADEAAVRKALSTQPPPRTVLRAVRTTVIDYETAVAAAPLHAKGDDALWRAAILCADAFEVFHDETERRAAIRLLERLTREYPDTPYRAEATARRDMLNAARGTAGADVAPRTPAVVSQGTTPATAPSRVPSPPATAPRRTEPVSGAPAAASASAASGRTVATVTALAGRATEGGAQVSITLDREVAFTGTMQAGTTPAYALDLPQSRLGATVPSRQPAPARGLLGPVRTEMRPGGDLRVTVDLTGSARCDAVPRYTPFQILLDCVATAAPRVPTGSRAPVTVAPPATRTPPASADARTPPVVPPPPAPSSAAGAARVTPAASVPRLPADGPSMARQLGLGVARIVIDPGHGGHDPGTLHGGLSEADIVLDVAQRVAKLLRKDKGLSVLLTRTDDRFVPLSERTAFANANGADLFLSIHVNAAPTPDAKGVETYVLDFADTLSASAVAARENAASGQTMGELPDAIKQIALHSKLAESRTFARLVQRQVLGSVRQAQPTIKDLGVKQAPFLVLIGAAMPSVLSEIAFLTNPDESALLAKPAYRQRVAQGLADGIRAYAATLTAPVTLARTQPSPQDGDRYSPVSRR